MEVLSTPCICGDTSKFLRRKGAAIGLYCANCEKWFKWVGKKDIEKYKHRGFKIHDETYTPYKQTPPSYNLGTQQPAYDSHSNNQDIYTKYAQPVRQPSHSPNVLLQEDELDFKGYEDDYRPSSSLNGSTNSQQDEGLCLTCISGVLEPLYKSNQISATIHDGVMNIKNLDKTKLYGSFSINFCPNCGKKL